MKRKRHIGQEILNGLEEITAWQEGRKKLKTIRGSLLGYIQNPSGSDVRDLIGKVKLDPHYDYKKLRQEEKNSLALLSILALGTPRSLKDNKIKPLKKAFADVRKKVKF